MLSDVERHRICAKIDRYIVLSGKRRRQGNRRRQRYWHNQAGKWLRVLKRRLGPNWPPIKERDGIVFLGA